MRPVATRFLCFAALALSVTLHGGAQDRAARAGSSDPRVGLKAGFKNAGEAAHNLELVSSLPKPEGFFDPKQPAGQPTPPERDPKEVEKEEEAEKQAAASGDAPPASRQRGASALNFANSDLAFQGNHLFIGNFHGFNTYNIENARRPRQIASVVCPGGQGDVSVHGNLLFMSVEQTRGRLDCGTEGVKDPVSSERFRGIRIFDITDVSKPKQVAAVQTCRGSHTHTLVTKPGDTSRIYVYGSGTSSVRSAKELAGCSGLDPKEDPNTALFSIDVIEVPLASPQDAKIVSRPRIFADLTTGNIAGLW